MRERGSYEDREGERDRERERGRANMVQTIIPEIITTRNMKTYYFTVMLSWRFQLLPGPECIGRSWETLLIRTARN